ncbi:MAG TPA: HEAT repeat domain-containing protein [Anaerohalosphaeraceae bacterium]|nr:HEAT repeat domain-containing protein [Anaerohalosphaeraceae bacterium]HPB93788.1 HEAT repeat domain-containing protein [Anaerohalosphaeraceae bacterium]HRT24199.1 HEAT repeat domain-containing protein [Anaerohalosphaeraceae bacterium]HRU15820.1 HEAT repeat domain-containing protein [Anaerohalosphaeraceae bacterium]
MRLSKGMMCAAIFGLMAVWAGAQETAAAPQEAPSAKAIKNDWNDFLHYTLIGRFDLAQGFGQRLLDSKPDPLLLLELSEENPRGYELLLKVQADNDQLREIAEGILKVIEEGRYLRRTDPKIILAEIARLNTTIRGKIAAQERLKNAGEYAVPFLLSVLEDSSRREEFANIVQTLPMLGRSAIRPLTAALQTPHAAVKAEIIEALGAIGYFEPLPYLKYTAEKEESSPLREAALAAIARIDSSAQQIPAAELFFQLAEKYYNREDSVAPSSEFSFANIWFWDAEQQMLSRVEVSREYFYELMAMRCCEWALKADAGLGKAIGLWLAAYFRAESYGIPMPAYFGEGHASAMTYAVTAGPEYLMQALSRALKNREAYVALQVVEALAVNAGSQALLTRIGLEMPLADALQFEDPRVRYSAAIALGQAGPVEGFAGNELIVPILVEALLKKAEGMDETLAERYSVRAMQTLEQLAVSGNQAVDLSVALDGLIEMTHSGAETMRISAGRVLAYLSSPQAQRAIVEMAMEESNSMEVRTAAFASLAESAKRNGNLLLSEQIESLYQLVQSRQADAVLRQAAAGAFGALNLPSQRVKDLILEQARS